MRILIIFVFIFSSISHASLGDCTRKREYCSDQFDVLVWNLRDIVSLLELIQTTTDNKDLAQIANQCEWEFGGDLRTNRQFFLDAIDRKKTQPLESSSDLKSLALSKLSTFIDDVASSLAEDFNDSKSTLTYFEISSPAQKYELLLKHSQEAKVCIENLRVY